MSKQKQKMLVFGYIRQKIEPLVDAQRWLVPLSIHETCLLFHYMCEASQELLAGILKVLSLPAEHILVPKHELVEVIQTSVERLYSQLSEPVDDQR